MPDSEYTPPPVHNENVVVSGEGVVSLNGIFDPAIWFPVEYGPRGWMTYSSCSGLMGAAAQFISCAVAETGDYGKTWQWRALVFASQNATVAGTGDFDPPPGQTHIDAFWHYEVSTMIYDPNDADANKRYKMLSFRIFWTESQRNRPQFSWLVMKTAPTPRGTWSAEVAYLGTAAAEATTGRSFTHVLDDIDPALEGFNTFSEPCWLVVEGWLYLGFEPLSSAGSDGIHLIRSNDSGASWEYVGHLLPNADAVNMGFLSFSGGAMYSAAGRHFLMAVPGLTPTEADPETLQSEVVLHNGCMVFEIEDIAAAKLVRNHHNNGLPKVMRRFDRDVTLGSGAHGGGQAGYWPGCDAIYYSQIDLYRVPKFANIYKAIDRETEALLVYP